MVESSCPICASPVLPGQSHCARCGASLAGSPGDLESTPPEAPSADIDTAVDYEPHEDPRLSLVLEPPPDEDPLARSPGGNVPPSLVLEPPPDEDPLARSPGGNVPPSPGLEPPPDEDPLERSPGGNVPPSPSLESSDWALRPSNTGSSPRQPGPSLSVQLGAKPISLTGRDGAAAITPEPPSGRALEGPGVLPPTSVLVTPEPIPQPEPSPAQAPFAAPLPFAATPPFAAPPPIVAPPSAAQAQSASPFASPPAAEIAPQPPEAAPAAAPRKESVPELVAFGLVAAGVSIGIASLFLPWAGATGIGIGTEMVAGSPPPANQWGWGMPAGFPLFLLSLPVLLGAGASDRIQARFPNFAHVVSRVTDLILPIILGGLYLGVALMYMTVPASFGAGLYLGQFALALGAGLMIAGAIVTVFFPPNVDRIPD